MSALTASLIVTVLVFVGVGVMIAFVVGTFAVVDNLGLPDWVAGVFLLSVLFLILWFAFYNTASSVTQ